MNRRKLIALLGSSTAAVTWSIGAIAYRSMPVIGLLRFRRLKHRTKQYHFVVVLAKEGLLRVKTLQSNIALPTDNMNA